MVGGKKKIDTKLFIYYGRGGYKFYLLLVEVLVVRGRGELVFFNVVVFGKFIMFSGKLYM